VSGRREISDADLAGLIRREASAHGLRLDPDTLERLTRHAADVLAAQPELHLTSIVDPEEFVPRHVGESLQGAALLAPGTTGLLVDLGSGNGYPGLPMGMLHPGLRVVLTEVSSRKARFLRGQAELRLPGGRVLCRQIQRAEDLADVGPVDLLVTRAMGGWEKIVPRLQRALSPGGQALVWAGTTMERVVERKAWRRLHLVERRPLAGRDRSWIWRFSSAS
jgi:16S rRNA (guanine527-N7)-methyltransferase